MTNYSLTTKMTWAATQQDLAVTFDKWGVREWDTNYPRGSRLTGMWQSEEDRTVTLQWRTKEGRLVKLVMGKQQRAVDNLRVLYLAVEAMRLNEVRGIGEVLESAYKQIGEGNTYVENPVVSVDPWTLLEISPTASLEVAEASYRAKARRLHPDAGGFEDEMKALNNAIDIIRKSK